MASMLKKVFDALLRAYKHQGWWPLITMANQPGFDERGYHPKSYTFPKTPEQALEVCIGAILTQNTSWRNVEAVVKNLAQRGLLNRDKLLALPLPKLGELIRQSGYYNQKAKKIKAFLNYNGPTTREGLLSVWGVGPETVDSMLLYAYHKPVFVVDAYTKRILSRLGIVNRDAKYNQIQDLFHESLPREEWLYNEYHALLVEHAKQHCKKKPECNGCPLLKLCRFAEKQL